MDEAAALTGEVERSARDRNAALCLRRRRDRGAAGQRGRGGELTQATLDDVESRGEGMGVGISRFKTALLNNGLGRYAEALAEAERACEYEDLGVISLGADRASRGRGPLR